MKTTDWLNALADQFFSRRSRRRAGRGMGHATRSTSSIAAPNGSLHSFDCGSAIEKLEDRTLLAAAFPEFVDPHPAAGNQFGSTVVALSTGNVVITSPLDDAGGADAGAVYLFNGATGALISTLTGSSANDRVGSGSGSVTALSNGNYVVSSGNWDLDATHTEVGAVTFGSGTTGVSGTVSSTNSLVGSTTNDFVGINGVTALSNGNFVVSSAAWDSGTTANVGAVTFGSGTTGISGAVSVANSLVGSAPNNEVGNRGVTALSNGNYVVISTDWDSTAARNVGAATFGSGTTGISGVVSAANSLVGSRPNDFVGSTGVTALSNGNYVVNSQSWANGATTSAGAATFGSGTVGISGEVNVANSLVGSTSNDLVGYVVMPLSNGNYVVLSRFWDNGAATDAGAVTFGSGTTGISGVASAANSLVGSTSNDFVGNGGITALSNGNYVVRSSDWDNGAVTSVGAVTFGSGTTGISGAVSSINSFVGSTPNDFVGSSGVTELTNGNYVIRSEFWDNGAANAAGAVTFGSGTTGISGVVSAANSLVGSKGSDTVGSGGVTVLANGNYVIRSPFWDNGGAVDAGSATFGSGTAGVNGLINNTNSAIGLTSSTSLQTVVVDDVNSTFFGRFVSEVGGKVRVGSHVDGFAPSPAVNLSVSTSSGTEAGQTQITVTVTAATAVSGNQTVNLAASGTGVIAGDFTLTDGDAGAAGIQIKILNSQTTGSVTFTIVDDLQVDGLETATLTISNPSAGIRLGSTTSRTVAITDNDTASSATFASPNAGSPDSFRVVFNGANVEIRTVPGDVLLDSRSLASLTDGLKIQGEDGQDDALTVDFSGSTAIPSGGLTFNGGTGGNDSLTVTGGTTTSVTHTFTNANDGSVRLAGTISGTITYTGLEPITDNLGATDRVFSFNGGAETITLTDAAGANMTIDSDLAESVTFANPTGSLTINAGTGADTVSITSVDAAYHAALVVNGDAAEDIVNLNADITFSAANGLQVIAETINIGANTDLVTTGTGSVSLTGDAMSIDSTASINVGLNTVMLIPLTSETAIDLGGDDRVGTLGLTDAELDRITAGTVQVGDTNSGVITVSTAITHANSSNFTLTSGSSVLFNPGSLSTGGGTLTLTSGTAGSVQPITNGTDATTSSASTMSFGLGADLAIAINGTTVDTEYRQLGVAGQVNLSGVDLVISGAYTPTSSDSFTIVNNDGTDPVIGTFNGLAQGAIVIVNGVNKKITYAGGDGNDVVLVKINEPPTNISLSGASVSENSPTGTAVGTLAATDPDAGDSVTFTLVDNAGGRFSVVGNELRVAGALDFEAASTLSITVRATDSGGLSFDKLFSITVTNVNEAPSNISLSNASITENNTLGSVVGSVAGSDPDVGDSLTFSLVDSSNGRFRLFSNSLKVISVLNFESASTHSITVRATDVGGLSFDKIFSITVTDVNEKPTGISLSNASVVENSPAGTAVGDLSGSDPDVGASLTYSLVSGTGSNDNATFLLNGAALKAKVSFDYETKSSYSVRVRATDAGALFFEKSFTISVTDVANEPFIKGAFGWAIKNGATSFDFGEAVATDAAGNVYVTGIFRGTVDFDPGPQVSVLGSPDGEENFVAKYDPSGTLIWAKAFGGSVWASSTGIAVDGNGNVYTTGRFGGTVDFNPSPGTGDANVANITSANDFDMFVSKLDRNGNYLWAKTFGGRSSVIESSGIALDRDGNVYTTGSFFSTIDFNPSPGTGAANVANLVSRGRDVFVSKLDVNGNYVWAKAMGSTTEDKGLGIAVDGTGNVYTTGYFRRTADFNPNPGTGSANVANLISAGESDAFVSKLDVNGNYVWAKALGGSSHDASGAIAVDGVGNLHIGGHFSGVGFVSKLDASGNFVWDKRLGAIPGGIAVDNSGNVYTSGSFSGTVDFDPSVGTGRNIANLYSAGGYDVFVSKLDVNGDYVWAKGLGGSSDDLCGGIALSRGDVYTTGSFYGSADFNPASGPANVSKLVPDGSSDMFLNKLSQSFLNGGASGQNGYLVGSTAFFDANFNGALDSSEPATTTDDIGAFALEVPLEFDTNANDVLDDAEGQWVVFGGTDSSTGLPAVNTLIAPASWSFVTPLTTLVSVLVADYGLDTAAAMDRVNQAMGLPDVDLRVLNPIAQTLAGDSTAAQVFAAHARVQDTISQSLAVFEGAGGAPTGVDLSKLLMAEIAALIAVPAATIDCSDAAVIGTILAGVESSSGVALDDDVLVGASTVIAATNQLIDDIPLAGNGSYLTQVAQVKRTSQGPVAEQLESAAKGILDIVDVVADNTGTALAAQVAAAATPPTLIVPASVVAEATSAAGASVSFSVSATNLAGESVPVVLTHNSGDQFTIGATIVTVSATDGGLTVTTSFTVIVIDTVGPELILPADLVVPATAPGGANVTFEVPTAVDLVDPNPVVVWDADSDFFPLGTTTVTVTTTDAAGNVSSATFSITIIEANQAPVAVDVPIATAEDTPVNSPLSVSDVENDPLTYTIVTGPEHGTLSGTAPNLTYTPALNYFGPDSFTYLANDGAFDSNLATILLTITAVNDPPTVIALVDSTVQEGDTVSLSGMFTDPDSAATHIQTWSVVSSNGEIVSSGDGADYVFVPHDNGTYTVTYTVADADGGSTSDSVVVTVRNVVPVITGLSVNSAVINEDGSVTVSGSFTDVGTLDTHTVLIDWGNGETSSAAVVVQGNGSGTFTAMHQYLDDNPTATSSNPYTITATVTDDDGGVSSSSTVGITVNNVAPTVGAITAPLDPVAATIVISVNANFTDSGVLDTHSAVWYWGDASNSAGTVTETNGSGSVTGSHAYSVPGVYVVTLTVTDDDGGSNSSVFQYLVVYNPNDGFVTGGGWIDSPAGAYAANPQLSGKASFGFVARYQNGASAPTGNTEFQFKAGDFNFRSVDYQWLVVAGANAKFKGTGTVNGQVGYQFMITAHDGQMQGSDGVDKFRIKVWNAGGVVYDNQPGASDDSQAATALKGGSIVIHKDGKNLVLDAVEGGAKGSSPDLTDSQLSMAVTEAMAYWAKRGLSSAQLHHLQGIQVNLADLSGNTLGLASQSTNSVWIDMDAAGYAWSLISEELHGGSVDLLSTLTHEFGHVLGYDHDVMGESLHLGERHLAMPLGPVTLWSNKKERPGTTLKFSENPMDRFFLDGSSDDHLLPVTNDQQKHATARTHTAGDSRTHTGQDDTSLLDEIFTQPGAGATNHWLSNLLDGELTLHRLWLKRRISVEQ